MSRPALQAARHATYGEWSFRDTPSRVRERYFTPVGKRWRLAATTLAGRAGAYRTTVPGPGLYRVIARGAIGPVVRISR